MDKKSNILQEILLWDCEIAKKRHTLDTYDTKINCRRCNAYGCNHRAVLFLSYTLISSGTYHNPKYASIPLAIPCTMRL